MKYQLHNHANKMHAELMIENITPAKTAHILGYGVGVTFSSSHMEWCQSSTFLTVRLAGFTRPTVVKP
jgi:hypothetical protein